jgi:hypothetical protein
VVEVPPEDGVVEGLEEDGEGELELAPFFDASSPHAARVKAATAAISRDLVITGFLERDGGRKF